MLKWMDNRQIISSNYKAFFLKENLKNSMNKNKFEQKASLNSIESLYKRYE